jgi:hypothetical protein
VGIGGETPGAVREVVSPWRRPESGLFSAARASRSSALQVETGREVAESIQYILKLRARGLVDRMSWGFATAREVGVWRR